MKFSIGQVSKLYNISKDTLRHYDKIGILKPEVNESNGYRFYSIKHLDQLGLILLTKDLGISLSDIKSTMESGDLSEYKSLMIKQERLIKQKIETLKRLEKNLVNWQSILDYIINYENEYNLNNIDIVDISYEFYGFDNIKDLLDGNMYADYIQCLDESLERLDSEAYYYNYNIFEGGKIQTNENQLFIREYEENKDIIQKYIIDKYSNINKVHIQGKAVVVKFYGCENDINEYLISLNKHFNFEESSSAFIRFEFYMPKEEKYFVEIILKVK